MLLRNVLQRVSLFKLNIDFPQSVIISFDQLLHPLLLVALLRQQLQDPLPHLPEVQAPDGELQGINVVLEVTKSPIFKFHAKKIE